MSETRSANLFVGRKRNGEKVYVSARFELLPERNVTWRQKTDHTYTTERLRVAFGGVIIRKGGSIERDGDWAGVGQVTSDLLEIAELADDWTIRDVIKLHDVWKNWHLHDMRAGCEHQDARLGYGNVPDCPETGYKFGSEWLYESIPYSVFVWVSNRFDIAPPEPGTDSEVAR